MAESVAIVTPWYPTNQRPFHGSFVEGFADTVHEGTGRPVHVYHLESWGLPRGQRAARRVRTDLANIMRGPAARMPLRGDGIRTTHLPAPVRPGSTFGAIAHDHHQFFGDLLPGGLEETIVHAHVGLGGGWPAMAMLRPSTRLFVTEHATFLDRLLEEDDARERYDQVIARSEGFFCVGEGLRARLLEHFPHRHDEVSVLPNPIRFSSLPPRPSPLDPLLRRWLYVGYLTERKGVIPLLEAFAIAHGAHGDLRLTMAGEGPLAERIAERAAELGVSDRVELVGAVDPSRMPDLYGDHDLLVHLSDYETFGMTLVEAVAVGCAVLVTRCGGPEETVGPIIDQVGLLVDATREPDAVAAGYAELRARSETLDLNAGRVSLESRYSFETVARRLESIYAGGVDS